MCVRTRVAAPPLRPRQKREPADLPDLDPDAGAKKKKAPPKKEAGKKGGKKGAGKKKKGEAAEPDDPAAAAEAEAPLVPMSLLPASLQPPVLTIALPAPPPLSPTPGSPEAASPVAQTARSALPDEGDPGDVAAEGGEPGALPEGMTAEEAALLNGLAAPTSSLGKSKSGSTKSLVAKYTPIPDGLQPAGHRSLAPGLRARWDAFGACGVCMGGGGVGGVQLLTPIVQASCARRPPRCSSTHRPCSCTPPRWAPSSSPRQRSSRTCWCGV